MSQIHSKDAKEKEPLKLKIKLISRKPERSTAEFGWINLFNSNKAIIKKKGPGSNLSGTGSLVTQVPKWKDVRRQKQRNKAGAALQGPRRGEQGQPRLREGSLCSSISASSPLPSLFPSKSTSSPWQWFMSTRSHKRKSPSPSYPETPQGQPGSLT